MASELKKRIFTSIGLLTLTLSLLFIHPYLFIAGVYIFAYTAYYEISNILLKNNKIKKVKFYFLNAFSLFYFFIIFGSACIILYSFYGPKFFLFILLISAFSDIGGYIFGRTIGGKKLTKISPKKTISGSAGSFLFSIIPLVLFDFIETEQNMIKLNSLLFCLLISLSTQIGDIFISYLKRKAKVKDTGSLLPGHGGVLDRIDGLVLAVPTAYYLLINLKLF